MPVEYEKIFSLQSQGYGHAHSPTPEGFAALARAGRNAWNEWRRAFPTRRDETGVGWMHAVRWRQQGHPEVAFNSKDITDFSGFEFGDGADFQGIDFQGSGGRACFDDAQFGDEASFRNTIFRCGVSFRNARFDRAADLRNLNIQNENAADKIELPWANFAKCRFGNEAVLELSTHALPAADAVMDFTDASFGDNSRIYLQINTAPPTSIVPKSHVCRPSALYRKLRERAI